METTSTTTITAAPCGKDRHGLPLKPRQYVVDHRREDWGDGRTRIFVRRPDLDARPGQQCFAPQLVRTDSIVEQGATPTRCPASGRTATWCEDQTHFACYAAQRESVALDRRVEAVAR